MSTITSSMKAFIPPFRQIVPVYALQVLLVYGWAIIAFFYELPRWRFFLSPLETGAVFAYAMLFAFLDSVVFLAATLMLGAIFYRKFLQETYVPVMAGVSVSIYLWTGLLWSQYQHALRTGSPWVEERMPSGLLLALITTILLALAVQRIPALRKFFHALAERAQIFLYLYLPLSLLSLLVVVTRNWI